MRRAYPVKRQAAKQGLAFTALDNGFASCQDPAALAAICERLSVRDVHEFFERWLWRLPSPLTAADRARGYRHALAFRQLEISDTHVFQRPAVGRGWFERTLPDQLCLGRPDEVSLIFDRKITRRTPGRFLTRVLGRGVEPALQIRYKHSKLKQYFKEGRALRTETTINDTKDFGIGRSVTDANFKALIAVGHATNQRLLDHQLQACQCAPDATTLQRVVLPSIARDDGTSERLAPEADDRPVGRIERCWPYRQGVTPRLSVARRCDYLAGRTRPGARDVPAARQ